MAHDGGLAGTPAVADFEEVPATPGGPTTTRGPLNRSTQASRTGTGRQEWFTELVSRASELRHGPRQDPTGRGAAAVVLQV